MALDRLVQVSSSRAVTATPNRSGGKGRCLAQGQTSELSLGELICRTCISRQAGHREQGEENPGVDGEVWDTPDLKAAAVQRIARVRGYLPKPLKRKYIAKSNGKQRPLSIPVMEDRGRQAVHLQALSPIAETLADLNSYGFRSKRQCADAIDQCFKILRQTTSATVIYEGDIAGFFDNIDFSWIEENIPMDKRLLSKWLRSGYMEEEAFYPTTQGVPQGGLISPVIGNMTLDGLEQVVRGKTEWFRRKHNINFVRYADDFIITANNNEVLQQLTPQIEAFLDERGVSLSKEKTKITHISEGFDFLGQNVRKHVRANGQLGKIQITPSKASFQRVIEKVKLLTKRHRGATPKVLIEKLNPVLRGWANYHRHVICGETFGKLDSYVWGRLYRWCKRRHPDKTGRWIAERYFLNRGSHKWRFTDPGTGTSLIKVAEEVKHKRHVKIRSAANPFDPEWDTYFEDRDRKQVFTLTAAFTAKVYMVQDGICPGCRQLIQHDEETVLYHR
ncbi:MAG: group II intron reverse transcriptase/maturase, partial [Gammaproteobacteria bacterium]|nr:group II intron reverse transcriptase/maturase [Gammaproteobacteria bacterium]